MFWFAAAMAVQSMSAVSAYAAAQMAAWDAQAVTGLMDVHLGRPLARVACEYCGRPGRVGSSCEGCGAPVKAARRG